MRALTWDGRAFRRALTSTDPPMRAEDLARELENRGYDIGLWAIRKWMEEGSPGPHHRRIAVDIAEILGCTPGTLVKEW